MFVIVMGVKFRTVTVKFNRRPHSRFSSIRSRVRAEYWAKRGQPKTSQDQFEMNEFTRSAI